MKLLRIVGWLLGIVVLLIVVAAIALPMLIDPNELKSQISQQVEAQTGRKLTIDGDLGLSVFPWLGVDVGSTSLANASGFSDQPFAEVETVQIRVKLLPLLSKQLEMDTVVLKGLHLSLETNGSGTTNWDDLSKAAAEETPETAVKETESSTGEMALAGLAIGGVEITDARVIWDDKQAGARYEIDGLDLRTGAIEPGATVPVELKLKLDSAQPQIKGPLGFTTNIALSDDQQEITLTDANLVTDLEGAALPAGKLKSELGFDALMNMADQKLDVTGLVLEALGLKIQGDVHAVQLFDKAAFNGELKVDEFSPRAVIEALGQEAPETSDSSALDKADAVFAFMGDTDSVEVTSLLLHLDDSSLNGNAGVKNFASPAIRFSLNLDQIDADRYLPPPSEAPAAAAATSPATAATSPTTAAAATTGMIQVETLRALNVQGDINIGKLKVSQLHSSDILIQLRAKDGLLRVNPAKARLYNGGYTGDVQLDVRGKQPKISLNEKLSGVQVGPLLKDLTGDDKLSGTTNASAKLTTVGQNPDQFTKALNGDITFSFTDGAVKGFDLITTIRQAKDRLKGKPVEKTSGQQKTDFSEISGTAKVTNGVVNNQDLKAKSPLLRVTGKGTVDLPRETLDYLVTAKIVGSLEGQEGKGLDDLEGVSIPVKLGGTFAKPSYQVKLDKVLQDAATEEVKEKVQKKLEKKFGDKLKGLF